jgi:hypothetical protein
MERKASFGDGRVSKNLCRVYVNRHGPVLIGAWEEPMREAAFVFDAPRHVV